MKLKGKIMLIMMLVSNSLGWGQHIQRVSLPADSPIMDLSEEDQKIFKERILEVVTELTDKISTIGDKSLERTYRRSAVKQALKLFMSEDNIVEVSSVNRKIKDQYNIKDYLNHLYALPYLQVEIIFYEVAQISKLERTKDNTWRGTAYIYQLFKGYDGENRLAYTDRTIKRVEIIIKEKCKTIGDTEYCFPEVRLGDIRVTETRKF